MNKRVIRELLSWIAVISIAILLAFFINKLVIYPVQIPSGSMKDTIQIGDRVMTFRLAYLFREPKRGDVVVFKFPDNEEEDYIKRIIGLPGDTVEGKDGIVYINGSPIEEPYAKDPLERDFGPYEVPEESYFMLGDNRNGSADSRLWRNKYVHIDKIYGKAVFKYPKFELIK